MKKLFIVLFLFASNYSYSQYSNTWQVQNTFTFYTDIDFIDNNTGCAVGGWGTIIKTTNNGLNWRWVNSPSRSDIQSIELIGNIGWIIGGGIFYSTDFCETWKEQLTPTPVKDVDFIDVNTGWRAEGGFFYKTTTGGINWSQISTANLEKIYFLNENIGIGTIANKVLRTSNSGISWDTVYTHDVNTYKIYFANNNSIGYVTTQNDKVLKTTNQGISWNLQTVSTGINIKSVFAKTDNEIYALGQSMQYYISTNGGNNWTQFSSSGILTDENSYDFVVNNGNFIQAGTGIFISVNNGTNWSYSVNSALISPFWGIYNDVNFVNENTGYIGSAREGGFPYQGNNGFIFKTTNGGNNWNMLLGTVDLVNSVEFVNDLTGWHTGYFASNLEQFIKKTTNGGNNFVLQATSWFAYDKIKMKDINTGFISGTTIWRTTNSGVNWATNSQANGRTHGFDVSNDFQNIYAACDDAKFVKSTNGGINFTTINLGTFNDLYDVEFVNDLTGFMVGDDYDIYKTTNGGLNWTATAITPLRVKNSVQFINEQTGWVAGNYGSMFYTSNSGTSWIYVKAPTGYDLLDIHLINSNTGFCVGEGGTILYTNNGGIINIRNENVAEEKSYLLLKNYPNPFNPSTTISFSIPRNDNYELMIYDINGKLVDKIFNKHFVKGNHEITWNADAYPSGVYFAKLKNEKSSITIKLLLIK